MSEDDEFHDVSSSHTASSGSGGGSKRPQSASSGASDNAPADFGSPSSLQASHSAGSGIGDSEPVSLLESATDRGGKLTIEGFERVHAPPPEPLPDDLVLDDAFDEIIAEDWGQEFDLTLNKITEAKARAKAQSQKDSAASGSKELRPQSAHSKFRPQSAAGRRAASQLSMSVSANMEDDSPDGRMLPSGRRRQKSASRLPTAGTGSATAASSPSSSAFSGHGSNNRVFVKTSRLQEPLMAQAVGLNPARRQLVSQQSSRPRPDQSVTALMDQLRSRNRALEASVAELQISNAERMRPRTSMSNR